MMRTVAILGGVSMAAAFPALAAWEHWNGGVAAAPAESNSSIERLVLNCADGAAFDVYSPGDGVLRPRQGPVESDYFYRPGFIVADVDGREFPLVAAGSGDAVVLYSEGSVAENYLAPLHPDLVEDLKTGRSLVLRFDLTSGMADDGSAFETFASFPLENSGTLISEAMDGCK